MSALLWRPPGDLPARRAGILGGGGEGRGEEGNDGRGSETQKLNRRREAGG